MSRDSRESSGPAKQPESQSIGATEAAVEGIRAIAPGLSLSKILSDVGEELKHQVSQGSHELAAALFNGSAFVMYPRHENQESVDHGHGLPVEAAHQVEPMQKEVDTGREM